MSKFYNILALSTFSVTFLVTNLVAKESTNRERSITLRELREAYLNVNGGRQNIESVKSIKTVGRITYTDESKVITFRTIRKRPRMIRHSMTYPNDMIREFLVNKDDVSSKIVFSNGEERSDILGESEIESLRQSARMQSPFMQTDGRSDWLEFRGLESLGTPDGEIMAYRLIVLSTSGLPFSEIWLDQKNYQEVLVVARNAQEAINGTVRSTFYRKFDEIGGLQYPTELLVYEGNQKKQTIIIDEIKTNIGIFESYFNQAYFLEDAKPLESP